MNENDNNKNRKYLTMDKRVRETYAKDSKATNKNKLSDPYVKAFQWAADRIGEEGVIAFVTSNSFLDGFAFDGMRKHLANDFDAIYVLDWAETCAPIRSYRARRTIFSASKLVSA